MNAKNEIERLRKRSNLPMLDALRLNTMCYLHTYIPRDVFEEESIPFLLELNYILNEVMSNGNH